MGSADLLRADTTGLDMYSAELLRTCSFDAGRVGDARRMGALPLLGEGTVGGANACKIGTRFAGLRFGSLRACRGCLNRGALGAVLPKSEVVGCFGGE